MPFASAIPGQSVPDKVLSLFGALVVLCCAVSVLLLHPAPLILPAAILFVLFAFAAPRKIYYLFFFLLPFSIEIQLPGGLGTDLPSEPMMVFLMGLCLLLFIIKPRANVVGYSVHPLSIILITHVFWILFTTLFSSNFLISFKYLLAKTWYIVPFYVMPFYLFRNEQDFRRIFKWLFVGLFVAITFVMFQHSQKGFSFASINKAVRPIFRNHVNYAIMLVAVLPYLWYLIKVSSGKWRWPLIALGIYLLLAIYLTYTRAAQVTALATIGIYLTIQWKMVRTALIVSLVALIGLATLLSYNNKYLDFAPDYEKTITHYKFDDILAATYKMQDISTVERFYRWIAGFYMVKEKPLTGYGPSTFYSQYQAHTVKSYKTYVSDNPEKSGIHNNYLMVAVEQGVPGLIIMLLIAFLPLIFAERLYHKLTNPNEKTLVMAAAISFAVIDIVILINDLIEADKVGPFYFLAMSIIVFFSVRNRSDLTS